jgi:Na+-transporting NADH:ubiquinone oxidoreductase subunit C
MKEKILMIVFVLILGSVLTSALVAVAYYTGPRIERNKVLRLKMSVLGALDVPYTKDSTEEKFSENIEVREIKGTAFYVSQNGNMAFEIAGSGLWGPISGVLALLPDLKTIKGITITHQEETPGLGGRIAEREYLDRFKDKKVVPELRILAPGKAKEDNEVDGITGATLSSKAFEKILNSESKKYISLIEENE